MALTKPSCRLQRPCHPPVRGKKTAQPLVLLRLSAHPVVDPGMPPAQVVPRKESLSASAVGRSPRFGLRQCVRQQHREVPRVTPGEVANLVAARGAARHHRSVAGLPAQALGET